MAAAITAYNSGRHVLGRQRRSWPSILRYLRHDVEGRNSDTDCHSCAYSIGIRSELFGEDALREYIWEGDDADNDGNPDWCFAYGEEEWVNPYTIPQCDGTTQNATFDNYQSRAEANPDYRTACN
ncbi:MAG: hypothetical protein P8X89_23665 [Reinekea sp.]